MSRCGPKIAVVALLCGGAVLSVWLVARPAAGQVGPDRPGFYYVPDDYSISDVGILPDGTIFAVVHPTGVHKMCALLLYEPGKSEPATTLFFSSPDFAKKAAESVGKQ